MHMIGHLIPTCFTANNDSQKHVNYPYSQYREYFVDTKTHQCQQSTTCCNRVTCSQEATHLQILTCDLVASQDLKLRDPRNHRTTQHYGQTLHYQNSAQ